MFKRNPMTPETKKTFLPMMLVILSGLAVTAVATWVSWQSVEQRLRGAVERRVETHIRALEYGINARLHQVEILRSLFTTSKTVSVKEFRTFIENISEPWEGINTLVWIPWKATHEATIHLRYCAPAASCDNAFISALTASPELRQIMEKAEFEARTVASAPVALPRADNRKSTLVIAPVFRHDVNSDQRQIRGFALGVFIIADLVELILGEQTVPSGLDLYFYQGGNDGTGQLLYYHPTRTMIDSQPPLPMAKLLLSRHYMRRFPVADNMWTIMIRPDHGTLTALRTFEPWMVLGGGLLITFLLATYIMANLRRTARIEAIVEVRTAELNAANVQFNKAREQAEQANRAKSRFLAAASHDLRQPLQALNLFVNVLSNRDHDKKSRKIVEHIGESTLALENLLNALLDISKLDAGLIIPEVEDVPVRDLFRRLERQFAPLAAAKGLCLKMKPLPLVLRTDPILIENIMRNLITNAVRYTKKGRIVIRCRKRANSAVLMVEDTGPGIPENQRKTVFEEFSRLDRERGDEDDESEGGLGLGLAIVDRMARLLGHQIKIASAPKKGSVFIVEVPFCGEIHERDTPEMTVTAMKVSEGRVLVIDDEPNVLLAMCEQLKNWGYSVLTAQSLEQALTLTSPDEPVIDLILADYRLGNNVTGDQVIHAIRDRLGSDVPGLLITGDTAPDRLREAQASGFRFLHKPVPPAKLHRAMEEAMSADGHGA